MVNQDTTQWLLDKADPALAFQVHRDLLRADGKRLRDYQSRIAQNGIGRILLEKRRSDGHWGNGVYNPKWTCTHYVLYELVQLGIAPSIRECGESASMLLAFPIGKDGGINYARTVDYSDVCINGMILNIVSYFGVKGSSINALIDFLLSVQMEDGGWNCEYCHGARKSSLHTTISVLEGISRFIKIGGAFRNSELEAARSRGVEFILKHELYKTATAGEVIKDDFLKYGFPVRWKYDILRCLDYFQSDDIEYDARMRDALSIIAAGLSKRGFIGSSSQPGKVYPDVKNLTDARKWNTLRALRVAKRYGAWLKR